MSLYTLKGTFYKIEENVTYGYENGSLDSVYNYSVQDIIDFYKKPISLSIASQSNNDISNLVIESKDKEQYTSNINDNYDLGWDSVVSFCDLIFNNYETVYNDGISSFIVTINATLPEIDTDSFVLYKDVDNSHISYVTFDAEVEGNIVFFEIYFKSDDMISKYGFEEENISIYNIEGRGESVDNEYWETNIVSKLLSTESSRNYKNFIVYETTRVEYGDDVEVDRYITTFYILNHVNPGVNIDDFYKIILVKSYLVKKHFFDYTFLAKTYPDLFSDITVNIYPVTKNKYLLKGVHPLQYKIIKETLSDYGVLGDPGRAEIFYLEGFGPSDSIDLIELTNSVFRLPLLAIEDNSISTIPPISSRYPNYSVRATGMPLVGEPWEVFHHILKLSLKLSLGIIDHKDFDVNNIRYSIPLPINFMFKIETGVVSTSGEEYVKYVEFILHNVTYRAYGPIRIGG